MQPLVTRALACAQRKHKDKPDFEKFAVYLLGNLAVNERLKDQIGLLGGINITVELMEIYPLIAQLIENCARAAAAACGGSLSALLASQATSRLRTCRSATRCVHARAHAGRAHGLALDVRSATWPSSWPATACCTLFSP
jgi:hypothetical protein